MIFEIKNDIPTITPEGLSIPELLDIWSRDKGKEKSVARKKLAYIYHTTDPKSVYSRLSEEDRIKEVAKDFMGRESYTETREIKAAREKYEKMVTTHSMRLLKGALGVIDKLSTYLEEVDFAKLDPNGKPAHSAKEVIDNMKKIGPLIDSLNKIKDQVRKEHVEDSGRTRGGAEFNMFEE